MGEDSDKTGEPVFEEFLRKFIPGLECFRYLKERVEFLELLVEEQEKLIKSQNAVIKSQNAVIKSQTRALRSLDYRVRTLESRLIERVARWFQWPDTTTRTTSRQ